VPILRLAWWGAPLSCRAVPTGCQTFVGHKKLKRRFPTYFCRIDFQSQSSSTNNMQQNLASINTLAVINGTKHMMMYRAVISFFLGMFAVARFTIKHLSLWFAKSIKYFFAAALVLAKELVWLVIVSNLEGEHAIGHPNHETIESSDPRPSSYTSANFRVIYCNDSASSSSQARTIAFENVQIQQQEPQRTIKKKIYKRRLFSHKYTPIVVLGKRSQSRDSEESTRPHKTHRTGKVLPTISEAAKNLAEIKRPGGPYKSDLIVVLDLDECLVHAEIFEEYSKASSFTYQVQNTSNNVEVTEGVETFLVDCGGSFSAQINLRPGVLDFLEEITSKYETHIYTAAMSIYADPVLDHLCSRLGSPNSDIFAGRWYRQHCAFNASQRVYVKDLSHLPVPLHRTVLVDNNPDSFLAQPENGILVNSFFADGSDRTLPKVAQLISELEPVADVRHVLANGPVPVKAHSF
jgi:Dullard-like phosphatase family protein